MGFAQVPGLLDDLAGKLAEIRITHRVENNSLSADDTSASSDSTGTIIGAAFSRTAAAADV